MNFDNISQKHMNELELQVRELLMVMRKAKLENESLEKALHLLEEELGAARRARFDASNSEYDSY